jgi:hypothetical protein
MYTITRPTRDSRMPMAENPTNSGMAMMMLGKR